MSRRVILIFALLLGLAVFAISALPTQTKHALHIQGAMHPWLHVLSFALIASLLMSSTRSDLVRVVFVLLLLSLGYATEANESRRNSWAIEARDVRSDAIGVLFGTVVGLLLSPKQAA